MLDGLPEWRPEGFLPSEIELAIGHLEQVTLPGERLAHIARWLASVNVPFKIESPEYRLNTQGCPNFSTFDCATFAYTVNALAAASSSREFAAILDAVRYRGLRSEDNLIHYSINSFVRFSEIGILEDVTAQCDDVADLRVRTVRLDMLDGLKTFIDRPMIGDLNRGQVVSYRYIATDRFSDRCIANGDTLLLVSSRPPDIYPGIVGHIGIATFEGDDLTMIHCSKSPTAAPGRPPAGVSWLRHWNEEQQALSVDNRSRPFCDYLKRNPDLFAGVGVFRHCHPRRHPLETGT